MSIATLDDLEARTYSTLSGAVRLRASARRGKTGPYKSDVHSKLEKTVYQLGGLLTLVEHLDFNLVPDEQLRPIRDGLVKLYETLGSSLSEVRSLLDGFGQKYGSHLTEEYEPFIATLTRDQERLASIIGELALHFSEDFRNALKRAVANLGPASESSESMDWRKVLGSMSD